MKIEFTEIAWNENDYWLTQDRKTVTKINRLIKTIQRDGLLKGEGKPEKLRYQDGYSRKIDEKNRLVYVISNQRLIILSCKDHYDE